MWEREHGAARACEAVVSGGRAAQGGGEGGWLRRQRWRGGTGNDRLLPRKGRQAARETTTVLADTARCSGDKRDPPHAVALIWMIFASERFTIFIMLLWFVNRKCRYYRKAIWFKLGRFGAIILNRSLRWYASTHVCESTVEGVRWGREGWRTVHHLAGVNEERCTEGEWERRRPSG